MTGMKDDACIWCERKPIGLGYIGSWKVYAQTEPFRWYHPDGELLIDLPARHHMVCDDCGPLFEGRKVGALLGRRPADVLSHHDDAASVLAFLDQLSPPVTVFAYSLIAVVRAKRVEDGAGES